jgi:hypothetical protein
MKRGIDIDAGCGQLTTKIKSRKRSVPTAEIVEEKTENTSTVQE